MFRFLIATFLGINAVSATVEMCINTFMSEQAQTQKDLSNETIPAKVRTK